MMDIKGLFVWTLGSVIRVIQLISTLKKLFLSYLSITWIMIHSIQGNNNYSNHLDHSFFIYFLSRSVLAYTSRNPVSMGLRAKSSGKNRKPIYVIKRTSGLCEWLLQSVTQWLDQLDHQSSFVCVLISRITWINGSVIHFFQTNSPK